MKQTQFITLMSESLGVEEKTIKVIVRTLREDGLFTTGARGVNAPDMTTRDAVRVVLAAVASTSPSRASRDVRYFGALKPDLRLPGREAELPPWIGADLTLEAILLKVMENEAPVVEISGGSFELSEIGSATMYTGASWLSFHQREQWAEVMKQHQDEEEHRRAVEQWEAVARVSETKIARSASFNLGALHSIGFEMLGWPVD